jgi:hypothetical protein
MNYNQGDFVSINCSNCDDPCYQLLAIVDYENARKAYGNLLNIGDDIPISFYPFTITAGIKEWCHVTKDSISKFNVENVEINSFLESIK